MQIARASLWSSHLFSNINQSFVIDHLQLIWASLQYWLMYSTSFSIFIFQDFWDKIVHFACISIKAFRIIPQKLKHSQCNIEPRFSQENSFKSDIFNISWGWSFQQLKEIWILWFFWNLRSSDIFFIQLYIFNDPQLFDRESQYDLFHCTCTFFWIINLNFWEYEQSLQLFDRFRAFYISENLRLLLYNYQEEFEVFHIQQESAFWFSYSTHKHLLKSRVLMISVSQLFIFSFCSVEMTNWFNLILEPQYIIALLLVWFLFLSQQLKQFETYQSFFLDFLRSHLWEYCIFTQHLRLFSRNRDCEDLIWELSIFHLNRCISHQHLFRGYLSTGFIYPQAVQFKGYLFDIIFSCSELKQASCWFRSVWLIDINWWYQLAPVSFLHSQAGNISVWFPWEVSHIQRIILNEDPQKQVVFKRLRITDRDFIKSSSRFFLVSPPLDIFDISNLYDVRMIFLCNLYRIFVNLRCKIFFNCESCSLKSLISTSDSIKEAQNSDSFIHFFVSSRYKQSEWKRVFNQ